MALDKAIQHGKEHRRPRRRSAAFDPACRVGGSCPWCQGNRTIQARREEERTRVSDDGSDTDEG